MRVVVAALPLMEEQMAQVVLAVVGAQEDRALREPLTQAAVVVLGSICLAEYPAVQAAPASSSSSTHWVLLRS
jgi:hypothetical protein